MERPERAVIRTGSAKPSPVRRQLRAGPLIVTLEEGALRWIRLASPPYREVLHGIYAAVRDQNWNTIEPRFLSYEVEEQEESFAVHFVAEHTTSEINFVWRGTITGSSTGEIVFTFDGQARRAFRKNRIGFCVLHAAELAGAALEIETPSGTLHGVFPVAISPHQPFKDITAIRYSCSPAGGSEIEMELRFAGELFEMEDQRNWTDASYKTYCTPLSLPSPVELAAGERIVQSVTLRPVCLPAARVSQIHLPAEVPRLTVRKESIGSLPALGFGWTRHTAPLSSGEIAALRALQPAYLWVELDLARPAWEQTLAQARHDASLLHTGLELSVVCDDEGQELVPLFRWLSWQRISPTHLSCFSRTTHVTTRAMIEQARTGRALTGLAVQLCAGSRANFAEFNRADLPLDLVEGATYPINPQVHAFDSLSLVETLPMQAVTVHNARRIAAGLPLTVGPVTLKPRFNAVSVEFDDLAEPDTMPTSVDPRQMSLFGACWTVGSLYHLASAGTEGLTYYEASGWHGLLAPSQEDQLRDPFPRVPGAVFPLYHIFADVAEFRRGEVLATDMSTAHALEALAVRQDQRLLVLIANMSEERQSLHLSLPRITELLVRTLDETTTLEAMYRPEHFRHSKQPVSPAATGEIAIGFLPFSLVHLEGAF